MISQKKSSHVQEKWFNEWYAACINFYNYYSCDILESWGTTVYFSDKFGVGGVSFLANSVSPNDPVIEAWECGMIL